METLNVEVPVSVGDKMYRITNNCVQEGEVTNVIVTSEYYKLRISPDTLPWSDIKFIVTYGYRDKVTYKLSDLGINVFPTREGLIKHIIES